MILIERPCCDELLAVDDSLETTLRCEACAVEWSIADPDPAPATRTLPALAA